MPSNALFLDANILLAIILGRNKRNQARQLLKGQKEKPYISALTAHLVVHFGQAIVELPTLRKFLGDYIVLSLERTDFEWAFMNMRGNDFEDALQIAVAIRNGCDSFATFDKDLAKNYEELLTIKTKLID